MNQKMNALLDICIANEAISKNIYVRNQKKKKLKPFRKSNKVKEINFALTKDADFVQRVKQ